MTYFGFLAIFLALPIGLLLVWHRLRAADHTPHAPWRLQRTSAIIIALHVIIALLYTTPWDNYLVATGVWWYDPARVTGLTIGWVPIEEYTFFILQPILSGLLLLIILQNLAPAPSRTQDNLSANTAALQRSGAALQRAGAALQRSGAALQRSGAALRTASVAILGVVWLFSLAILLSGWDPGVYLSLELVWALPPIMLQFAFGADILWRYRKSVLAAVLIPTLFLAAADMLAIGIGIWTIDPAQSLHLLIAGVLPVEELIFFLLTNTLIVFGVSLSLAPESRERFAAVRQRLGRNVSSQSNMRRSAEW